MSNFCLRGIDLSFSPRFFPTKSKLNLIAGQYPVSTFRSLALPIYIYTLLLLNTPQYDNYMVIIVIESYQM